MIDELEKKSKDLDHSINLMWKYGRELSKAKANYYKRKAEETFKLQTEGVAATTINNVIKGLIVKELLELELAQSAYDTTREHINVVKKQIEIIELQAKIEWSEAGRNI